MIMEDTKDTIDRNSPIPLYYQLKEIIKSRIESGELLPDDPVEPEWEICKKFDLSRSTVRKAMTELKHEGLINQVQGRGTFVNSPDISHRFVTVVSFTEELLARGIKPSSKLLAVGLDKADKKIAEKLEIKIGEPVYSIRRLRLGDGKVVGVNLSRIPASLCPGLLDCDLTKGSLYTLLEKHYGHQIKKAVRILETLPVDGEIAGLLGLREGFPILNISGVSYNQDKVPIDFCLEHYTE